MRRLMAAIAAIVTTGVMLGFTRITLWRVREWRAWEQAPNGPDQRMVGTAFPVRIN